ncbi:MAG: type II secretion system protein GspG [Planctomycetes bacterium]|nr:type II secretion system protein GspG [Planctomycetota bacterium]MBI3847556.1 type II secretion system protein GspG [Planctomycetota bacterium]
MNTQLTNRTHKTEGFSLIELVFSLAVITLLAGLIFPTAELYLRNRMISDTHDEMKRLSDAVFKYYENVGAFPSALGDLETKPAGASNWEGPYIRPEFQGDVANNDDYRYDAWRTAYVLISSSSTVRRIRSWGPNRTDNSGSSDDIDVDVDISPVLREQTRQELDEINLAIVNYNSTHLPGTPLSTTFATLLTTLQTGGYLPSGGSATARYSTDGWGHTYIPGPAPVQEVTAQGAP